MYGLFKSGIVTLYISSQSNVHVGISNVYFNFRHRLQHGIKYMISCMRMDRNCVYKAPRRKFRNSAFYEIRKILTAFYDDDDIYEKI